MRFLQSLAGVVASCLLLASKVESHYLPDIDRILDAVDRSLAF